MTTFSLLIKPVGSACNLACRYCYYGGPDNAPHSRPDMAGAMSDEVLERTISAYMATEQPVYSMVWHGGEPTLLPVAFFERVIELQKKHAPRGARIANSLQTNGVNVSQELAALLGKYRFLCGVSMDGPAEVHDRYRVTRSGHPTHQRVQSGLHTLAAAGVQTNTLALVTNANVDDPVTTYRYLRETGATHLHFIPCVEWDEEGNLREEAVTGDQWGRFLVEIFREWRRHDVGRVSVRLFESVLAQLVNNMTIDCYNSDRCDRYLVVEANGDIYPCDFYVDPAHRLGNVMDTTFEEARQSRSYDQFTRRKTDWAAQCGDCEFLRLCMGDCRKFRADETRLSHLCEGWKMFYTSTLPDFLELARHLAP